MSGLFQRPYIVRIFSTGFFYFEKLFFQKRLPKLNEQKQIMNLINKIKSKFHPFRVSLLKESNKSKMLRGIFFYTVGVYINTVKTTFRFKF